MKIAVTSQNFKTVTNHAGKARRFIVFNVEGEEEPKEYDRINLPKDMSFHEFGQEEKHPVDIADVIISSSFGMGFAKKMDKRGIIASLTTQEDPIAAVKEYLEKGQVLPSVPEISHSGCQCSCSCHEH